MTKVGNENNKAGTLRTLSQAEKEILARIK